MPPKGQQVAQPVSADHGRSVVPFHVQGGVHQFPAHIGGAGHAHIARQQKKMVNAAFFPPVLQAAHQVRFAAVVHHRNAKGHVPRCVVQGLDGHAGGRRPVEHGNDHVADRPRIADRPRRGRRCRKNIHRNALLCTHMVENALPGVKTRPQEEKAALTRSWVDALTVRARRAAARPAGGGFGALQALGGLGDAAQRCRFRPGRLPDRVKQNRSFGHYGTGKSCLQPSGGGGPLMPFFAACGQRKARDKGLRAMRATGIVLQASGSSAIMRQGSPVLSSRRRGKVLTAKVAAPAAAHRAARL